MTSPPGSRPSPKDRVIRVFISSTFRDMMAERDLLVKQVFPQLRRKCARRFVTFTEVDLRWGITEEQANEGQVLPLCLAEIERSRPYFLGLLGERYGWVPDSIRPEVIEREPWLRKHVEGHTSVTELEVLHGVLNDAAMQSRAFFCFRDPHYAMGAALTDEQRRELVEHNIPSEVATYGEAEATRRTEERKAKLAALKQRIRESGLPVVENYAGPDALAEIVRRQLDALIDDIYPEADAPDVLTQERWSHEAYATQKLFACIDRPVHLAALNTFAEAGEQGAGLVVTGESGGGKTILLAAWARSWAASHTDEFLFQHYFGATPESASADGFLRRLLGELKGRFAIADDIPSDPDKLREALPLWLAQTVQHAHIVLLLDGLNQVQGSDPDRRLAFLPRHFPPHVTVLASSLPGPALDALRERGWTEHHLPLADESEVDAMVGEYFRLHGRHVDVEGRPLHTELRRQLVSAPGSKNPLFLRTVLEELRQFGSFEKLPQRVAHYLEAGNPRELFLRVLRRWQEDFDGRQPEQEGRTLDLVHRALTHLWAARQGLSEPEWLDLLGDKSEPLPRALWSPLFLAIEPHLSQRAGLFAFGHDYLRQAVETAFVSSPKSQQAAHLVVADYFEHHPHQQEMTTRKAAEWPSQLHAAAAWERLEACLTNIPLFLALFNERTQWELTGYWHPLRRSGRDMGECYAAAFRHWSEIPTNVRNPFVPAQLGVFLMENGLYPAAEPLLRRALEGHERVLGREHPDTLASVNNLAHLLRDKGDYAGAEPLYRQALETCERVLGPEHPNTLGAMNNLSGLLRSQGDYAGAEPLCRRALAGAERMLGPEHPDTLTSVDNLGYLLHIQGDYEGAEPLYRRALAGSEHVLGRDHPATLTNVNNLAHLLRDKGDYAGAEPLVRRALEGQERVLGRDHPATLASVSDLAHLLRDKGDYAGAEPFVRRALEGQERVLGPEHPHTLASMNSLALLLQSQGDYAGAEPLYRRALTGSERVLGPEHPNTLATMNNLASLLRSKGDSLGAEPLVRRALQGHERVLGPEHPHTLASMNSLALLLQSKGDYAGAEPLYRRALEVRERVLGPENPNTLTSVNNLASLLQSKGDYMGAEPLFWRALEVYQRVLGREHPDTLTSMNNLAYSLQSNGAYAVAERLYRRALEGWVKNSAATGRAHPQLQTTVNNYASCLKEQGCEPEEIRRTLEELARPFGINFGAAVPPARGEPSPRLRAVLERLMADPSQAGELAAQLQREDPELFREFEQWLQNQ